MNGGQFRQVVAPGTYKRPVSGLGAVRSDYVNGVDDTCGYAYTLRSLSDDAPLTIHTRVGYDDVTGVGTPNGDAFLAALSS
ncbi:hypothetical protein HC031_22290 [Planosporangium thailandense]|uniref:Uncharacterized protein n=1 Tax=Planosporangium thailandense TaxID=765197 RepID=A0ABX0Y247_9ACTN|nr:hypothetical protein [Planosporangium thailandense]NJC72426.1 hypothetical protein [Planosporangium thailandense]